LKKGKRSLEQMYNVLSGEIGLSLTTVASFYRHQKWPQRILDKIEAKEDRKNSSSSSKNLFLSSANREIIRDGINSKNSNKNYGNIN